LSEACDDSNVNSNDGCSDDCLAIETGWECLIEGSLCVPICGDGLKIEPEECDDGNFSNED